MQSLDYKRISAIVLSGGRSSRMGTDKCDLIYNGKSLINIQIDKFRQIGIDDIIASGYRGKICDVKVIKDDIMKGPLSGILNGLIEIKHDRAFVISVDMPLVREDSIRQVIDFSIKKDLEVTVLRHRGINEPLVSVFKKSVVNTIKDILNEDKYNVMKIFDRCKSDFCEVDDDDKYYMNINYKADYDTLLEM